MHEHAEGVFLHDADRHAEKEHETEEEDAFEAGAVFRRWRDSLHGECDHDERPGSGCQSCRGLEGCAGVEDFDVEAVSVVPCQLSKGREVIGMLTKATQAAQSRGTLPSGPRNPQMETGIGAERRVLAETLWIG